MKVVLVDDEESLLHLTAEFLTIKGYEVQSFSAATDAHQWIADNAEQVQAIVTDEIMPGPIQGHDLVEMYSKRYPMILMTGYIDTEDLNKLEVPVIYKPFRMMVFADVFEHAITQFQKE